MAAVAIARAVASRGLKWFDFCIFLRPGLQSIDPWPHGLQSKDHQEEGLQSMIQFGGIPGFNG